MPEIDLSEVLLDVAVAGEPFFVVRRPDIVGWDGVTAIGATQLGPFYGSITPVGANSMLREEAFSVAEKTIRVTTSFILRGPSKDKTLQNYQPDLVLWRGDAYIVRTIGDFSQYGRGMMTAECSSIDYVETTPIAPVDILPP